MANPALLMIPRNLSGQIGEIVTLADDAEIHARVGRDRILEGPERFR